MGELNEPRVFPKRPSSRSWQVREYLRASALLDERNVEQQWLGQAPAVNWHRLRDRSGVSPVGTQGSFTLFRVGSA